ncbi:MAG: DNA adenine methylase [Chloroflexi bacterium]|nr:DNA adenine methylase [Chloroflexota bacterium]
MTQPQFLKYHGGKFYMADAIISRFPKHELYIEPFLGGGAVLQRMRGPRVGADVDTDLINLWQMLQDSDEFSHAIGGQVYCEQAWNFWTSDPNRGSSPIELAMARLIRQRFSRGGMGKTFAWSERLRGGQPGDVNAWQNFQKALPQIRRSIEGVKFYAQSFSLTMRDHDSSDTLFYCDPPYLPSTRTAKKVYEHEMSISDHEWFLKVATDLKGKVVISGYPNSLYDTALSGWTRHTISMPNHSGQGTSKQRRTEVLWVKP